MPRKKDDGKKEKRREVKKRKLEAFLNLVRKDSGEPVPKKKSRETFSESLKGLKDELKKYQAKQKIEPIFYLKDAGYNALVQFSPPNSIKCTAPLFFADIYHLLLKSILGQLSPFSLNWCTLERSQYITKTVVIDIGGLSESDIFCLNSELKVDSKIFQNVFKIICSKPSFASELSTFHMHSGFYLSNENHPLFPVCIDVNSRNEAAPIKTYAFSKLFLLLSPIQLAMENYPLPPEVFEASKCDNYVFTKDSYAHVTDDSPMFALDCEMCLTSLGNELTRIAVVDENLDIIYHTLVKPHEKILNYVTKYSGITEKMLRNVTTRLSDVHEGLRKILPKDAILCGQSLNCDLHALKMIHPYVIDTSVIFNTHGVRSKKTSLKNLSKIFLKETIQQSKSGHHPVEDSIATMKLVQLKLENSIEYGDAVLCDTNVPERIENGNAATAEPLALKIDQCGFFDHISKLSRKKVCLIGKKDALGCYSININDKVSKKKKPNNKKVIQSVVKNLNEYDLVISHLTMKEEGSAISDIVQRLKQAYESFPNRTLFLLMANRNEANARTFNHSYCMAVIKNVK